MSASEKAMELVEQLRPFLAITAEVQLADFGETAASGPYTKFRHPDHDDLEIFRGKDRATRTKTGTRYMMLLVEIQDDEKPVNQEKRKDLERATTNKKGGALSRNAGALCSDKKYQEFLRTTKPQLFAGFHGPVNVHTPSEVAKLHIYAVCKITSRAELDYFTDAAAAYKSFIKAPFNQWMIETGEY